MPWENDTELSDLAKKLGLILGWPWDWVAVEVEKCLEDAGKRYLKMGWITLDVSWACDEWGKALGKEVGTLDDREKRVAILKAMLREWA